VSLSGIAVIQTTASDALMTALAAARHQATKDLKSSSDRQRVMGQLTVFTSAQAHEIVTRTCSVLGIRVEKIQTFRSDNYALTGETLLTWK
jgi:glutamate/tyrosine decarboxylase-like PLP-dependent enzyme